MGRSTGARAGNCLCAPSAGAEYTNDQRVTEALNKVTTLIEAIENHGLVLSASTFTGKRYDHFTYASRRNYRKEIFQ